MLHRNAQKRIYRKGAIYFITSNTQRSYPYFDNPFLAELFELDLWFCQHQKAFFIYGYKLNPEHFHLLIQPGNKFDYSSVMNALKKNYSRNANYMMGYHETVKAGSPDPAFEKHVQRLMQMRFEFHQVFGDQHDIPIFDWQDSFHDHVFRNEKDFNHHIAYIEKQWIKHELPENEYCYVSSKKPIYY